jgi:hypothetical protein
MAFTEITISDSEVALHVTPTPIAAILYFLSLLDDEITLRLPFFVRCG